MSRRERRLVRGACALAAALLIAVVVSLVVSPPAPRHGCIDAVYAGPVGAEQIHRCGTEARTLCAQLGTTAGFTGEAARTIAAACHRAGYATRP